MNWEQLPEYAAHALRGLNCVITLYPRPAYCDRGQWLALLDTRAMLSTSIDGADLWPRFYFDLERAKLECEAWVKKRGEWTNDESAAMTLVEAGCIR